MASIEDLKQTLTVQDLVPQHRHMIVFNVNDKIEDVMQVLADNNILSAPVIDLDRSGQFVGNVDVLDLCTYIYRQCASQYVQDQNAQSSQCNQEGCAPTSPVSSATTPTTATKEDVNVLIDRITKEERTLQNCPYIDLGLMKDNVGKIVNLSDANPFKPVFANSPLMLLLQQFGEGVHRVPVMDQNGNIVNIISQTNVVHFFSNPDRLKLLKKGAKTLRELALGMRTPLSVSQTSRVLEALFIMQESKVNGLAVLDDEGRIVGSLSTSDLRRLTVHTLNRLTETLQEFLSLDKPQLPPTVTPSTTLNATIMILASEHIHRVWVIDEQQKPIGIVTLTDIIKKLR